MCVQPQGTPRGTVTSMCNSDVPSQAVYARFLMVVRMVTSMRLAQAITSAVMELEFQFAGACQHTLSIQDSCWNPEHDTQTMSHAESGKGALQVRYFTANGFYVLLDNQFNADDTAKAMPGQWVAWWRQVLQDVIADSASRNQVTLDLLNEPDSQFWKWENAGPAYLQAMDALHQAGLCLSLLACIIAW